MSLFNQYLNNSDYSNFPICLCVFVLDVSSSMQGTRIDEINKALKSFEDKMSSKADQFDMAIIAFNNIVSILQEPALIGSFEMPVLSASGSAVTVDALDTAIDLIEDRKNWYRANSIPYYRPWIILVTDGTPDATQDVGALSRRISIDTENKSYNFLPIGFGEDVDMSVLKQIQGSMPPMQLNSLDFGSFFGWLGASMSVSIFDSFDGLSVQKHIPEQKPIFISYKRVDKEVVFRIKDDIEQRVGVKCWIDLDGIESDAQFMNVIMDAINAADIFLFMYSSAHETIKDFETDWTVREIMFAQKKKKRIVFINIDHSRLSDSFEFMFGTKQQVDASSEEAMKKLYYDLKRWLSDDYLELFD